jgi:G:T-mismatch repair DNA endonuclease (very short patch repair protein)
MHRIKSSASWPLPHIKARSRKVSGFLRQLLTTQGLQYVKIYNNPDAVIAIKR